MSRNRISSAKANAIRSFFNRTEERIFKTRELQRAINENRAGWGISASASFAQILECAALTKTVLKFPGRSETRYCKDGTSAYELALTVKPGSYLSHSTALHLHELLEEEPNDIFVNAEQSPKPPGNKSLEQKKVDWAFQQKPRTTNNVAEYGKRKIYLLSGKNTGRLGVVSKPLPNGERLEITGIERTLIDAVVRPAYCGGVEVVQSAFRKAKGKISVNLLSNMLTKLDYLYPYHQSIGFFLDRAGTFDGAEIETFLREPKEIDFYLEHKTQDPVYSSRWRVHYPKRLDLPVT